MASAYASLVSLVHVLNRVQYSCPAPFDQLQIQSLLNKVNSLVDFLEAYSHKISDDFGRKMVHAAYAAEDTIEKYITDQILEESSSDAYDVLCQDLEKTIQGMDLIKEEAKQVKEKDDGNDHQLSLRNLRVDSHVPPSAMVKMVECNDELNRLMDQLTSGQSGRQIIPIVGMGGIGKTTLATNVYNHPSVRHYFDVKAWVTISQDFSVGKIIRPLLRDLGVSNVDSIDDTKLGERLHKFLISRRYLIILDDIWDVKAWDLISRFCPDNNDKSRILLTTRISDVGRTVGSCSPFDINLLNDDKSWELLSAKVFGEEACPPELEECGKEISSGCKGLPLAIVVVGGMLKSSRKTRENWEDVAKNISSIIGGEDGEHCLKILSLSYHQLPIHLKPCFLYLATYPYDYNIRVSELIKLWVADGFLRPNVGDVTLEEVALKYLEELGNRNLIMIKMLNWKGKMERLSIHDLVMDLCIREAQKERFLFEDSWGEVLTETIESHRRVVKHDFCDYARMQPNGFSRSYILFNGGFSIYFSQLRMLRSCALFNFRNRKYFLPLLVNLRLVIILTHISNTDFQKISMCWNLETVIADTSKVPSEIWNLRHLKHLIINNNAILPDPPSSNADFALQNLQTLVGVEILSDKVLDMIPNVKELRISMFYDSFTGAELLHGLDNLANCQKLEILSIDAYPVESIKFPDSLRKLTLERCYIPLEKCGVGLLPNLEWVALFDLHFDDDEWETVEGEFQKLKSLTLNWCYLKRWTVEDCCHFPSLEHLLLRGDRHLEEIPEVFGESMTLQSIEIAGCSHAAVLSAKQIHDDQQSLGNYDFEVDVQLFESHYYDNVAAEEELYSMRTDKFHVTLELM